ncbi:MAG: signal recognition particle-docking protein FtsY, partial [Serratia proteamaculans]
MAKDKKRGFFSWLGFGQKEEEQQQPETSVEPAENQAVETPAGPVAPKLDDQLPAQESEPAASVETPGEWDGSLTGEHIAESVPVVTEHPTAAETLAEEIVILTEQVAAEQQPAVVEEIAEPIAEVEPEPVVVVDPEVVEPEPEVLTPEPVIEPEPEPEVIAPEPVIEPEPEPVAVIEPEVVEPEPEVIAPEPEPLPASVALEPIIVAPAIIEEIEQQQPELLAPAVTQEQERPTKEGFFARLKRSLVKTK